MKLITLDPGHFHAALVQKTMYDAVSPVVHVYAPKGPDVEDHLKRIEGFNTRAEEPTSWEEKVYTGPDYLEKMLSEKKGNVVVISGNNKRKAEYIKACVDAGLNVLADKPMCINSEGYEVLLSAFDSAKKHDVLIYDVMTERSEITTILQKELVHNKEVFGELVEGTAEEPAAVKESVHHFFKYVSGQPIKRPGWYFDTTQQGEGIVDVTTHLLDLVMWECFPDEPISYDKDIEIVSARRWPTMITKEQYEKVTGLSEWPEYLTANVNDEGVLACYANGEIVFKLRGKFAKVSVVWNFQAPEGGGDTHYSVMRGTKADVIIKQGAEQQYRPELYIEPAEDIDKRAMEITLMMALLDLQEKYRGVIFEETETGWHVTIPDEYRIGHEAHFAQVVDRFLGHLKDGKLPKWEIANIKAKYNTTTAALQVAGE